MANFRIYEDHISVNPLLSCLAEWTKAGHLLTANRKQQRALLSLLRQLRLDAGIRQVDMARALGKPQAFVSYYESGTRRLDLLELRQICGVLGVPLFQFVRKFEEALQEIQEAPIQPPKRR